MRVWIKRPVFKIIAPIMVITLVMAGAAPASVSCEDVCDCCEGASYGDLSLSPMSKKIDREQPYMSLPGAYLGGHGNHSGFDEFSQNQNCHQGLEAASCYTEQDRFPEIIQSSGSNASRENHLLSSTFVILNPDLSSGNPSLTEILYRQSSAARAAPVPIYLLNLSILC